MSTPTQGEAEQPLTEERVRQIVRDEIARAQARSLLRQYRSHLEEAIRLHEQVERSQTAAP